MSILRPYSSCGCGDKTFVFDADTTPDQLTRITERPDMTCQYLTKEAACCRGCGSSKCVQQCSRYGQKYTFTHPDGTKEKRVRPVPPGMYTCDDVDCTDHDIDTNEENSNTIILVTSIGASVLVVILFLAVFQQRRRRRVR